MGSGHFTLHTCQVNWAIGVDPTKDGCLQVFPSLYTKPVFPSEGGFYFPSFWIWAGLVMCFEKQNVAEVVLHQFWARPLQGCQLLLSFSWNQLPCCKEALVEWDKITYRESTLVQRREQSTSVNNQCQEPKWVSEVILDVPAILNSQHNTTPWMIPNQRNAEQKNCPGGPDNPQ